MKHTPGPWTVTKQTMPTGAAWPDGTRFDYTRHIIVAEEDHLDLDNSANAKVIETAPYMLELLKKVSAPIGEDARVLVLEEIDHFLDRLEGPLK